MPSYLKYFMTTFFVPFVTSLKLSGFNSSTGGTLWPSNVVPSASTLSWAAAFFWVAPNVDAPRSSAREDSLMAAGRGRGLNQNNDQNDRKSGSCGGE